MQYKKFLRFCPNCNNYDESTGTCSYIHENILLYPENFIKHCDGKYLSLIKGHSIEHFDESWPLDTDLDINKMSLVTVYSSKNYTLFHMAQSILNSNGIQFFSSGEYLNILEAPVYDTEIKVFERDMITATKLLSGLIENHYEPRGKFDNYLSKNGIIVILILITVLIMIVALLNALVF